MARDEKCHICNSPEHAWCGFCSHCHEHTAAVRTCATCGDAAYEGEKCRTGEPHSPDPDSEALTACCGAAGYAYDHDPS